MRAAETHAPAEDAAMTTASHSRTIQQLGGPEDPVRYAASAGLAAALQQTLVDLIELHLQGKQAHWNLVGHNFHDLHLQLDQVVDRARELSDDVAERMRSILAVPDGRSATVVSSTRLLALPGGELSTEGVVDLVLARLHAVVGTARAVHAEVDAEDPTSADLLHVVIQDFEKAAWMLESEHRRV